VVTLLSLFVGFSAVYSAWQVASGRLVFPGWYLLPEIVGLPCMALVAVGLWKMKRWAVWVYAALFLTAIPLAISRHKWKWTNLPAPVVVLAIMGANYRRMK
jgi:glucose dehydrogenase